MVNLQLQTSCKKPTLCKVVKAVFAILHKIKLEAAQLHKKPMQSHLTFYFAQCARLD